MRTAAREDSNLPCFFVEFDGGEGLCSLSATASTKFEQRDRELPRGRLRVGNLPVELSVYRTVSVLGLHVWLTRFTHRSTVDAPTGPSASDSQ